MNVAAIVKDKGDRLVVIEPTATIADLCQKLSKERIGALPVVDASGRLLGMISERDIVRSIAREGHAVLQQSVERLMTRNVVVCTPDESVESVMEKMTDRRCRHLPVIERDRMIALVSIGDVVKHRIAVCEMERDELRRYIASG
jgi:CBS domain-containing protein